MELVKIEALLEAYFEGNTTLEQEATLRTYFLGQDVAPHLTVYTSLFASFEQAHEEVSQRTITLPKPSSNSRGWMYSVAAMIVISIGVSGFMFFNSNNGLTQEEQEALTAFNETKETLKLLSENFNKGTAELAHLDQFTNTKNKILK